MINRREERDATRRRRGEVEQAMLQLEGNLLNFDTLIDEIAESDDLFDGSPLKSWEPLLSLQKKKAVFESLKKQGKDSSEELRTGIAEIEERLRLVRGISHKRCGHHQEGPAVEQAYREAKSWVNTVAVKLHCAAALVMRRGRQAHTKTGMMLLAKLDADDLAIVSKLKFHLHKIEMTRDLLDKERLSPEDVVSIQPEIDQFLQECEELDTLDDSLDNIWDCIDLEEDLTPLDRQQSEHDSEYITDDHRSLKKQKHRGRSSEECQA